MQGGIDARVAVTAIEKRKRGKVVLLVVFVDRGGDRKKVDSVGAVAEQEAAQHGAGWVQVWKSEQ